MSAEIEWVVFDFGRVLAELHTQDMISQILELLELEQSELDQLLKLELDNFITGRTSEGAFFEALRGISKSNPDDKAIRKALNAELGAPIMGSVELIDRLKDRTRLAILSNTNPTHWRYVEQTYPFLDVFECIVVSHETGFRKPEEGIFRHAENCFKCGPEACLFMDDLPENISAAHKAGWKAFQFLDPGQGQRELERFGLL